ncbi:MAG: FAD-binding oxidoreductase [Mycobacteriales bacterium]
MSTDFAGLRAVCRGEVVTPTESGYEPLRAVWNGSIHRQPAAILRCQGVADVRAGVRYATEHGLVLAVRAGGHNIAGLGSCDGGLVLDLRLMQGIRVDPAERRVHVQGGVTWGAFDHETQAFALATTGGVMSTTGVAGFALGGGIGWLMRKHGAACDNLISVDLVTAAGDLVHASAQSEPELLWGLRGGGGNFGVATCLEFALHPVGPTVFAGPLIYPVEQARDVLSGWSGMVADLPDEVMTIAILRTAPPDPPFPEALNGKPVLVVSTMWVDDAAQGPAGLAALRALGRPAVDAVGLKAYVGVQNSQDRYWTPGAQNYWKSDYLNGVDDKAIDTLVAAAETFTSPDSDIKLGLMGGAVGRVAEDATAYGNRRARLLLNINTRWTDPAGADHHIAWTQSLWETLHRLASGVYVNFLGAEGNNRIREAYGEAKYQQLVGLKNRWDPGNVFSVNQNIPPT